MNDLRDLSIFVRLLCALGLLSCLGCNGGGSEAGEMDASSETSDSSTETETGDTEGQQPGDELFALQISSGQQHTCAIADDGAGTVVCWGTNEEGQIGQGELSVGVHYASPVLGVSGAVEVRAAGRYSCALTDTGEVFCWGSGEIGTLGNGENGHEYRSPTATKVMGAEDIIDIDLSFTAACGVRSDGQVLCWGANASANFGFESELCGPFLMVTDVEEWFDSPCQDTAREVPGIDSAAAVAVGGQFQCAVLEDRTAVCWGSDNVWGQLGNGSDDDPMIGVLTAVVGLDEIEELVLGHRTGCAARTDGSLWCWGRNGSGQLGLGDAGEGVGESASPIEVPGLGEVVDVTLGSDSVCAANAAGEIRCWGDVNYLFDTPDDPNPGSAATDYPTLIPYVPASVAVTTHDFVSCALAEDGRVYCWGVAGEGQTGNGAQDFKDYSGEPVRYAL